MLFFLYLMSFFFVADKNDNEINCAVRNLYNPNSPHILYGKCFNKLEFVGVDSADLIEMPPSTESYRDNSNNRYPIYYIRLQDDATDTLHFKVNKIKYHCPISVTTNMPLPEVRIARKVSEGGSFRLADSIFCLPVFSDVYNRALTLYRVKSYKVELQKKGSIIFSESVIGNKFTNRFMRRYEKLIPNNSIVLTSIILENYDGKLIEIPRLEYVIK